jgi:hypothetical protein
LEKMSAKKNVSQRHHIKGSSEGTSSYRKTPQPAVGDHMRWHVHRRPTADARGTYKKEGKAGRLFFGILFLFLVLFLFFWRPLDRKQLQFQLHSYTAPGKPPWQMQSSTPGRAGK